VVYGEDNRKDWYEVLDPALKEAAKASLGIFDKRALKIQGEITLAKTRDSLLCPTERFHSQKKGPFCSGFLVDSDLVLTAGHCVENQDQCDDYKFVFDYAKVSKHHVPEILKTENVYSCQKLISSRYSAQGSDWALIKLDRPVLDRTPLTLETSKKTELNTPLVLLGHPSSLPAKIAQGGTVQKIFQDYFVADLDSFGGNSGSAVLNLNTLKVEGILIRGRTDYKTVKGCYKTNICEEGFGQPCKYPSPFFKGEHVSKLPDMRNSAVEH